MPQHRNFDPNQNFPSVVMDALQEYIGSLGNFEVRIKPGAANTIQVPAGTNGDQVALSLEGRWRFITAAAEQAGSGASGLRDIWAVTGENSYAPGTPGEVDTTDYTFAVRVTAIDTPPTGFAHVRRIARALWDGTRFLDVVPYRGGALFDASGARTGEMKVWPFSWAPIGWLFCDSSAVTTANPALREYLLADGSKFGVDGSGNPRVPDMRGRVAVGVDGTAARLSANDALGNSGGEEKHTLTSAEIAAHTHPDNIAYAGAGSHGHILNVDAAGIVAAGNAVPVVLGGTVGSLLVGASGGFAAPIANPGGSWGGAAGTHAHTGDTNVVANHTHAKSGGVLANTGADGAHNNMQPYLVVNWLIKA